jgi:alkylation response protein AidB-like acyl-CoA dehydrogenase
VTNVPAIDHRPTTADTMVTSAAALVPSITARSQAIEDERRLPSELVAELVSAGCFRILLPAEHGGAGADLPSALQLFQLLASADGSVGWIVALGASSWLDLVELPSATFAAIQASSPLLAGVFVPAGTVTADGDGYRVSGRWGFASGCRHATHLYVNGVERMTDAGPSFRIAVLTPDEFTIEDTWTAPGLAGTGSHHVRVDGVVVPAERTLDPMHDASAVDTPLVRISKPGLFSLIIASVAVGIARGALDDAVRGAADREPVLADGALASSPIFHHELALADTELAAAEALLLTLAGRAWSRAVEGATSTLEERARLRAAAVWIAGRSRAVVETSYRAAGGGAVYAGAPSQRRLGDSHTLGQHFLLRNDTLATAGAILAGQGLQAPIF